MTDDDDDCAADRWYRWWGSARASAGSLAAGTCGATTAQPLHLPTNWYTNISKYRFYQNISGGLCITVFRNCNSVLAPMYILMGCFWRSCPMSLLHCLHCLAISVQISSHTGGPSVLPVAYCWPQRQAGTNYCKLTGGLQGPTEFLRTKRSATVFSEWVWGCPHSLVLGPWSCNVVLSPDPSVLSP